MDAILASLITILVSGLIALSLKYVDKKYNKAKEQIEKNSADVENMATVVSGFRDLNAQYKDHIAELDQTIVNQQVKIQEQDVYIHQLREEILRLGGEVDGK